VGWVAVTHLIYVSLNDDTSWKGDPNVTLSGQDIPAGTVPAGTRIS
jgi:hypothetical protein